MLTGISIVDGVVPFGDGVIRAGQDFEIQRYYQI